jgi:hypothetical protein
MKIKKKKLKLFKKVYSNKAYFLHCKMYHPKIEIVRVDDGEFDFNIFVLGGDKDDIICGFELI